MRAFRLTLFFSSMGILALVLSGCGEQIGQLYPVSGKVTLDDEPLNDAQISFVADAAKGNKAPVSPFGKCKDGSYSLTTKDKPGAPAGWYKVVVNTKYPGASEKAVELPKRYSDPGKSDLSVEVKPNAEPGAYDLKLKSK